MAHGKETPRQKMIGMMYLVLTAMLALNVTSSVLDAFALIDNGLSRTTQNYRIKNEKLYTQFENAYTLNKAKVGPWKNKADEIKKKAKEIIDYVQGLKKEVVISGEGTSETPAIKGDEVLCDFVENKSDLDKGATILINGGKATELKKKLSDFREYLVKQIDPQKAAQLLESINGILNTDNPPPKEDGEANTWESSRFEHIPLIAVIPQLTKVQVDVLNCEAEIVNYLLQQVGANDFKFNVLKATVIPSSTYVIQGNDFKAQVFLGASDTTKQPEILICSYDSTFNKESGEYDYFVAKGSGSNTIPVSKSGIGIYTAKATKLGMNFWSGLIQMTAPDGSVTRKPFKHKYEVAAPSVVISPSKMNVLYYGVDNPVEISIPGISMDKISATISKGSITKTATNYIVQPGEGIASCDISVSAVIDGVKRNMGFRNFRIKQVPNPNPRVSGISGKTVAKNELAAALGVIAEMPKDFDFDMKFTVTGFTLAATSGGFNLEESSRNQMFTEAQKRILNNLRSGNVVSIINIKAVGPKGDPRELNDLVIKIK